MKRTLHVSLEQTVPSMQAILKGQGIPSWKQHDGRAKRIAEDAISIYRENARPVGIILEITKQEFQKIFEGEGRNEDDSPVKLIYEGSDDLALFAVTIGERICSEIARLFQANDFAVGSMLDTAASEGTELAAQVVENRHKEYLIESDKSNSRNAVLRFSPGYCGWHISAQKKLFSALHPLDIGITLNDSYLMQPLKSISGVIISGKKEIFYFDDTFSFCRDCDEHTCRERIQTIIDQ